MIVRHPAHRKCLGAILLATGALAFAAPALADVKAGVDAWGRGEFAAAVAQWQGPAAKGDPDALFNLAQAYRLGRGVKVDLKRAETLYAQAAAKGHLKAADNYGLLLFQDGRREAALPYVQAAAQRGDPRAQYLLGIAHFNGDLVAKDWVRAYALLTLAGGAGLPQAAPAIRQMDEFIPLEQRQLAQPLAAKLRADADASRSSQMAAADLTDAPTVAAGAALPSRRLPSPVAQVPVAPSASAPQPAAQNPALAGADFARPKAAAPAAAKAAPTPVASDGAWKLQLGAFSVAGGADRLWAQLAGKPALAGKRKQAVAAGKLTKLYAAGWASQASAQAACDQLKAAGQGCIVSR